MVATKPVDKSRIERLLSRNDLEFHSDTEDELIVPTENAIFFWNSSHPQILQLRAQWRGIAENDQQFSALCQQISHCNRTRTGPKAYLAPLKNHRFGLVCENNMVATAGMTEAQLANFFETAMGFTLAFLHDLEQALPELVTWETTQQRSFIYRPVEEPAQGTVEEKPSSPALNARTAKTAKPSDQELADARFWTAAAAESKGELAAQTSKEAQPPRLGIVPGEECDSR